MRFIQNIFQTQKGLDNPDNYHQFCRLLARLKTNFQLSELVSVDGWVHTNLRGGFLLGCCWLGWNSFGGCAFIGFYLR
jgi:hypothetical protein